MPESARLSQMPAGKIISTHLTILAEKPTESDFQKVQRATPGFDHAALGTVECIPSPLRYIDRNVFRRFGIFLFDSERMASSGLIRWGDLGGPYRKHRDTMSNANRMY